MRSFFNLALIPVAALALAAQTPSTAPKPKPAATPAPKPQPAAQPAPPTIVPQPAPTPVPAPDPNRVVLKIEDVQITAKQFDDFIESLPDQYKAAARGPAKRQIAEEYVKIRLLGREARKRGLDKSAAVQEQIAFSTDNLLASALFRDLQATLPIDEEAVRKYYEENKGEYENVQARHILIRFQGSPVPVKEGAKDLTEAEALAKAHEVRKRILAGEDFAAAAGKESDDQGSAAVGGDLGSFKRGQMVPDFDKAAFSQKVGEVGAPLRTQFGYHIIKVEKHEERPLAEVRPELERRMRPELARKQADQLRKAAAVTFDDAFFPPPPMPMPPQPGQVQPGQVQPGQPARTPPPPPPTPAPK